MPIRLMVCDDHEVVRTGLATLLAGTNIEIVAEAVNGKDALKVRRKKSRISFCSMSACPAATASPPWRNCAKSAREQSDHVLDE